MKEYFFLIVVCVALSTECKTQEYKVDKSFSKLVLNLSNIQVEGHGSSQIIFSSIHKKSEINPKEKGLQAINGLGYSDNTGLGISVVEKETTLEVNEVLSNVAIKILVPKGVIVSFACHKVLDSEQVIFRNVENEIEIETDYNNVLLDNITGPASVRALYGSIEAKFVEPVKGPVSLTSIHSTIDMAIPLTTRANIRLKSAQNSILTSPDFKIAVEKSPKDSVAAYGSLVVGKLNGGGSDLRIASTFGKIYVRRSK